MRVAKVAEQIPEIAESLFDISPTREQQVIGSGVTEYGLLGITGEASAAFYRDGSIKSTGSATAYSGNRSDISLLGYLEEQTNPNVYCYDSLTYGQVDDACRIGMGALARIAKDPQTAMQKYGKRTLGRAVKSMVKHTLDHTFLFTLTPPDSDEKPKTSSKSPSALPLGTVLKVYPQITPEFVAEHADSFEILKPFFSRRDKKRIETAEEGKGPSFASFLTAEAQT